MHSKSLNQNDASIEHITNALQTSWSFIWLLLVTQEHDFHFGSGFIEGTQLLAVYQQ